MTDHRITDLLPDSAWAALARSLRLSEREAQIARALLEDESEAAIAADLRISPHTVHTHLDRLYRKLTVRSRCQAIARLFAEYIRLHGLAGPERVGDATRSGIPE